MSGTIIVNPGDLQTVAIAAYLQPSFYDSNSTTLPFLNLAGGFYNLANMKVPIIDLLDINKMQDLKNFGQNPNNYIFGLVESLSIKAIEAFKAVNTNTYSNFTAQIKSDNFMTKGSLKLPILIPNSDNYNFYYSIWQLGVFYFIPFFIYTSVSPINLGAPLFVENFKINVTENNPVSIEIDFVGGITLIPPDNIASPVWNNVYRLVKSYDCLAIGGVNDGSQTLQTDIIVASALSAFNFYLKSASLTIENKITKKFTANTIDSKNAADGVKYISLAKRKVSGSFEFLASTDLLLIYTDPTSLVQEITLYFSGPFYFQMKNVYIDYFGSELTGDGDSFVHNINFNAYLIPYDLPDNSSSGTYVSYYQQNEFNITLDQLGITTSSGISTS